VAGQRRELENVIERAVISVLHSGDLPLSLQNPIILKSNDQSCLTAKVHSIEYEMIVEALSLHKGNISTTAEHLSLTRRTLSLKMQKLGISYKQFR
jgi:Nif-specific regulatory protein